MDETEGLSVPGAFKMGHLQTDELIFAVTLLRSNQ